MAPRSRLAFPQPTARIYSPLVLLELQSDDKMATLSDMLSKVGEKPDDQIDSPISKSNIIPSPAGSSQATPAPLSADANAGIEIETSEFHYPVIRFRAIAYRLSRSPREDGFIGSIDDSLIHHLTSRNHTPALS